MSTQLTKIEQPNYSDLMKVAESFHASGMFKDVVSANQAVVKIIAGAELGIAPFASMSGIHIIQGKPTIGAGLMASKVKGSGKYNYKVVKQDETMCSIDFYEGKEVIGNSTFTIEDAKKAGTQNLAKYARNMLFARSMSNGVKWFCPDVFAGPVYTPEDFNTNEAEVKDVAHEVVVEKPELTRDHPKMPGIIQALREGRSMDELKAKFNVSAELEEELLTIVNTAA